MSEKGPNKDNSCPGAALPKTSKDSRERSVLERAVVCTVRQSSVVRGLRAALIHGGLAGSSLRMIQVEHVLRRRSVTRSLAEALAATLFARPRRSPKRPTKSRGVQVNLDCTPPEGEISDDEEDEDEGEMDTSDSSLLHKSGSSPDEDKEEDEDGAGAGARIGATTRSRAINV